MHADGSPPAPSSSSRRAAAPTRALLARTVRRVRELASRTVDEPARRDARRDAALTMLLRLVFERVALRRAAIAPSDPARQLDLERALPGLFVDGDRLGHDPIDDATVRAAREALDAPELDATWDDPTTPGWVYQHWHQPLREDLECRLEDW